MEKLTKTLKKQWIKALKSGDYPKGSGHLKAKEEVNGKQQYTYCCLGVLGEICGVKGLTSDNLQNEYLDFRANKGVLKGKTKVPIILQGNKGLAEDLANLNDSTNTFKEVIAYIDKNL